MRATSERPEMDYLLPAIRSSWMRPGWQPEDPSPRVAAYRHAMLDLTHRILCTLRHAGARFALGTDASNPFVIPGYAVHQELQRMVDAGFTRFEALSAATRDAAALLGTPDDFGTVTPGQRADLLLLEGNPLEDISSTTRGAGVMVRGRWLPREELQTMLTALAKSFEK